MKPYENLYQIELRMDTKTIFRTELGFNHTKPERQLSLDTTIITEADAIERVKNYFAELREMMGEEKA